MDKSASDPPQSLFISSSNEHFGNKLLRVSSRCSGAHQAMRRRFTRLLFEAPEAKS